MLRSHPDYPHVNLGRKDSVIYYARGDVLCMRSYKKPKDPKTPKQKAQRSLHALLTRISGQTKEFRDFCYRNISSYRSSHTAFIGLQLCQISQKCQSENLPTEAKIRWGRGPLPGTNSMTFSWKEKACLKWEYDKHQLRRQSESQNKVIWIVWNPARDKWEWCLEAGKRENHSCKLNLPQNWKGEELYIWLLFYDPQKQQFSSDSCLHVKKGETKTTRLMDQTSLFSDRGYSFEMLLFHWNNLRSFREEGRRKYWKDWFG